MANFTRKLGRATEMAIHKRRVRILFNSLKEFAKSSNWAVNESITKKGVVIQSYTWLGEADHPQEFATKALLESGVIQDGTRPTGFKLTQTLGFTQNQRDTRERTHTDSREMATRAHTQEDNSPGDTTTEGRREEEQQLQESEAGPHHTGGPGTASTSDSEIKGDGKT